MSERTKRNENDFILFSLSFDVSYFGCRVSVFVYCVIRFFMCNMTNESQNFIVKFAMVIADHVYYCRITTHSQTIWLSPCTRHNWMNVWKRWRHMWPHVCMWVRSFVRSFIFERFSSFLFLGDRNYTNRHCCVRFVEHIAVSVHVCCRVVYRRIFITYARAQTDKSISFIELHRSFGIVSSHFSSGKIKNNFFFWFFFHSRMNS